VRLRAHVPKVCTRAACANLVREQCRHGDAANGSHSTMTPKLPECSLEPRRDKITTAVDLLFRAYWRPVAVDPC
jgi:hypothetical protein